MKRASLSWKEAYSLLLLSCLKRLRGRFNVEGLPDGSYSLFSWSEEGPPTMLKAFELNDAEALDLGFVTPPALGSLDLRLTDEVGRPLRPFRVRLAGRQSGLILTERFPNYSDDVTSLGDGHLRFQGLAPDEYEVRIQAKGRQRVTHCIRLGAAEKLTLESVLPRMPHTVLEIEGLPRSDTSVRVRIVSEAEESWVVAKRNAKGVFLTPHLGLAPGQYKVLVKRLSGEEKSLSLEVPLRSAVDVLVLEYE